MFERMYASHSKQSPQSTLGALILVIFLSDHLFSLQKPPSAAISAGITVLST